MTTWVRNTYWEFGVLFTASKKHDIARYVTSQNTLLLFRVTHWNNQLTLCSTPHSQIVPSRSFDSLGYFFSKNLILSELYRTIPSKSTTSQQRLYNVVTLQRCCNDVATLYVCLLRYSLFYLTHYTPSTSFTQFLDRTIFSGYQHYGDNSGLVPIYCKNWWLEQL